MPHRKRKNYCFTHFAGWDMRVRVIKELEKNPQLKEYAE
jgi:hypothetical protein